MDIDEPSFRSWNLPAHRIHWGPAMTRLYLRAILRMGLGIVGAAAAGTGALIALLGLSIVFPEKPEFDVTHPDYARFAARFAEVRDAFATGADQVTIDLSSLNGGVWQTACLLGGFTKPIERMKALGAFIDPVDRDRLTEAIGWRVSPVEEFEVLIAFVDQKQRAHFIHFRDGVGAEGQHYAACVTKPQTTVEIDGWSGARPI